MPRKQVKKACEKCRRDHASCSEFRPCERCDIRGVVCRDWSKSKPKTKPLKPKYRPKIIVTPTIAQIIASQSLDNIIESYFQ